MLNEDFTPRENTVGITSLFISKSKSAVRESTAGRVSLQSSLMSHPVSLVYIGLALLPLKSLCLVALQ